MSTPQRWLLVSNCQTQGLANSLELLAEDVAVEGVDVGRFAAELERRTEALPEYDRVLAGDSALNLPGADFSGARSLSRTPEIAFSAYQPDLTYLVAEGELVRGPLDVYHSAIGFAAYALGRSLQHTLSLFDAEVFAACGYLDRWEGARDALTAYFASFDIDVSEAVRRWGRRSAFMYSTNHPRIHVLHDVARLLLERDGFEARGSDLLPHDNLAAGGVFPVYPEVADGLGVPGSYLFKRAHGYGQIDLRRYLEECFAVYDAHPPGALSVHPVFRPDHDGVAAVVAEALQ